MAAVTDPVPTPVAYVADVLEVSVGIPVQESGAKRATKNVLILAGAGASFYVVTFITSLMRGAYGTDGGSSGAANALWTAISSLLVELSIPLCGYFCALYHNRQLACCYCSCNLFVAIVSTVNFIRLNVSLAQMNGDCAAQSDPQRRRDCIIWAGNSFEKWFAIASSVLSTLLGVIAFWFGNVLYSKLSQDDISWGNRAQALLVGEVVQLINSPYSPPFEPGPIFQTGSNMSGESETSMQAQAEDPAQWVGPSGNDSLQADQPLNEPNGAMPLASPAAAAPLVAQRERSVPVACISV